jgi:hypothetical protein
LFYAYDAVQHFRAVQTGAAKQAIDFITWNAVGLAILRSREAHEVRDLFSDGFEHGGKRRSVVLIDEIDKAPRDFPNDLLNEIENSYFRVPELENRRIDAAEDLLPVLVLTSNSEKNLPDAFLRRCIFYNIPFPDRDRLVEIVTARLGGFKKESPPCWGMRWTFFSGYGMSRAACERNPLPRNCWDGWKSCMKWGRMPMNRCCCNPILFSIRSAPSSKARMIRRPRKALSKHRRNTDYSGN